METFGWTWDDLLGLPRDLIDEIRIKLSERNKYERRQQRLQEAKARRR